MSTQVSNDIIRKAQQADETAQREIIRAFHRPIMVTAGKYLRSRYPADIEDAVQDIFVKIFTHIEDFDFSRGVKFSTWVYTFVRNHCFDQLKRKRHPVYSLSAGSDNDDGGGNGDWIGTEETPDRTAERHEFAGALVTALNDLPDELRRIFKMREFDGFEFHAIARKLRLPLGTVKSKHYRALDRMRFMLRSFRLAC